LNQKSNHFPDDVSITTALNR